MNSYSNILNVDNFLFLIENFNSEIKINICHTILNQVINGGIKSNSESDPNKISDPYLAYSLLKIGKIIHDSIEISSFDNKKKEISDILIKFIRKIDFGIDFENHLNILTEARGNFYDLDDVIEVLISESLRIAAETFKIVKGKHNKKTLRFCKVCIAYAQITIPSLKNQYHQLKLILWTAQVAMMNNLISEADSLVKNAITVFSKIVQNERIENKDTELLKNFVSNLISFLIIVPSNPESPFQLITGLMNIFAPSENKTM